MWHSVSESPKTGGYYFILVSKKTDDKTIVLLNKYDGVRFYLPKPEEYVVEQWSEIKIEDMKEKTSLMDLPTEQNDYVKYAVIQKGKEDKMYVANFTLNGNIYAPPKSFYTKEGVIDVIMWKKFPQAPKKYTDEKDREEDERKRYQRLYWLSMEMPINDDRWGMQM